MSKIVMIKEKIEKIPDGTSHNIIQSIIWGDKEHYKDKFKKSNEQNIQTKK